MLSRDCDDNITLQSRIADKGRKEGHFIDNTFKGFYIHWLWNDELSELARHCYKWNVDNGVIFVDHDRLAREQIDLWKDNRDKILISIVDEGGIHWVLLVAHKSRVFFVDSEGNPIRNGGGAEMRYNKLNEAVSDKEGKDIEIHDLSFEQQLDGSNCGIFALENARIIERVIKEIKKIVS
ncbi:MAG: hypothetical protein ACEY3A_03800 [Wolbachia sp.]